MEIPRKQLKSQEIVHGSVPAAMEIPRKRLKSQGIVGEGEDDRISALPDGLLLDVLSRLPSTGDAIRTGILSKRWEHLWTLVPTLVFEQDDVKHSRSDFLSLVDKTLTQCRQQKLKKFQVRFTGYRSGDELQVNNWIRYAMGCNVEEVMLTLGDGKAAHFRVDQSLFIGSSITDLRLSGCILNPSGAIAWQSLKNLHLHIADLNEALIGNILCGSPALETLVLDDCYGFRLLNIASTSVKKLVYSARKNPLRAEYKKLVDYLIDVYAPFISSLTIQGDLHLWRLLMVNVSSLVEANLDYKNDETLPEAVEEGRFKILMGRLLHVKEIKIGPSCSKVVSRLEAKGFLFPSGVKFVKSLEDL